MASISPMESPQGALFLCRMWDTAPPPRLEGGRYLVLDGSPGPGERRHYLAHRRCPGGGRPAPGPRMCGPLRPQGGAGHHGACFRLPVWETGPERLAGLLERSGLALYATALREDTEDIKTADLSRSAVVIGERGARGLAGTARYEPAGPEDPYAGAV